MAAMKNVPSYLMNKCDMPPKLNSVAIHYGFGRASAWKWSLDMTHLLHMQKEVETFRPRDVILASTGVHFKRVCNKDNTSLSATSSSRLHFSDGKYESYVRSLLSIVNPAGQERCKQLSQLPTVLWRDVLPQHFPSSNGLFDPALHPNMTTACTAMTPEMYHGQSRAHDAIDFGNGAQSFAALGVCEPNCLPANWQNAVIQSSLSKQCISPLPVFDEVACLHKEHVSDTGGRTVDCTHYSLGLNHLINDRFLTALAK